MTVLQPVPAATVAILRADATATDLEVLLLRRNRQLVFHGGHWVFPGGRLDRADYLETDRDKEFAAARRAAVRETREESGIRLDPGRLIHIAHWTTPPRLPRRFSTWFFAYPLAESVDVRVDNDEILDYRWLSPRRALSLDAEDFVLPRPTRGTLEDLVDYRDLETLSKALGEAQIRVFPADSPFYRPASEDS